VYDISWSPDSSCLACGSVDNKTSVWDVSRAGEADAPKPKDPQALHDHGNFVTGVAWDPVGSMLATQSNDRSVRVYNRPVPQWSVPRLRGGLAPKQVMKAALPAVAPAPSGWEHVPYMGMRLHAKTGRSKPFTSAASIRKVPLAGMEPWKPSDGNDPTSAAHAAAASSSTGDEGGAEVQASGPRGFLFMDERVPSYFRRLDWSTDGSLLIAPTGQDPRSHRDDPVPTTNVFLRDQWEGPVMQLGGLPSASLVVRSNPVLFATADALNCTPPPQTASASTESKADTSTATAPAQSAPNSTAPAAAAAAGRAVSGAATSAAQEKPRAGVPSAPDDVQPVAPALAEHTGEGNLHKDDITPFDFPFRSVFAVATLESVFVYDTEHTTPVAAAANHHFEKITDLAWSRDGKMLLIASIDGSVSVMSFSQLEGGCPTCSRGANELGTPLTFEKLPDHLQLRPTPCTAAETRWLLSVRAHEQAKRVSKGPGRPGGAAGGGASGASGKQVARAAAPSAAASSAGAGSGAAAAQTGSQSALVAQPNASTTAAGAAPAAAAEGGVKRKRVTPTLVIMDDGKASAAPTGTAEGEQAVEGKAGGADKSPTPAASKARRITPTFVSS